MQSKCKHTVPQEQPGICGDMYQSLAERGKLLGSSGHSASHATEAEEEEESEELDEGSGSEEDLIEEVDGEEARPPKCTKSALCQNVPGHRGVCKGTKRGPRKPPKCTKSPLCQNVLGHRGVCKGTKRIWPIVLTEADAGPPSMRLQQRGANAQHPRLP